VKNSMKKNFILWGMCLGALCFMQKNVASAFAQKSQSLAKLKAHGQLLVCTSSGYAPFEVKTARGQWVGFDVELFESFAKRLGVRLQWVDIRWEGVFPALLSYKCDFITGGMSITPERQKVIAFSDVIYQSGNSLVILERDKDKYRSLEDLDKKGNHIAVKTGNTSDFYLQKVLKHATILRFDTNADMLGSVLFHNKHQKAQAFAQDTIYATMACLENENKLFILPQKLNHEDLAVGLRKQDTFLLKEFNRFLNEWKKEGHYKKAVQYYIESERWREKLRTDEKEMKGK
jgi:polar amino acid transport system substrate-binding protein